MGTCAQQKLFRIPGRITAPAWVACLLLILLALSGCSLDREIHRKIDSDQKEALKALESLEPSPKKNTSLMVDDRPWFGSSAVFIQNGDALPARLNSSDGLVLTFERPLTLREVGVLLQSATGIRVYAESTAGAGDSRAAPRVFVPAEGVEVAGGRIVWQGPLSDLLDQIADSFDARWTYNGSAITISDGITRTFMLHALAGDLSLGSEMKSESGGDAQTLPTIKYSRQTTLEIWGEIKEAVDGIMGDRGTVSYSPSTGTITVNGPPSTVGRVEEYLREQNRLRMRRVAVAVKVLSLQTSDVNSVTFNLSGIIERAIRGKPFTLKTVDGGLTAGILRSLPAVDEVTGFTAPDVAEGATTVTPDADTLTSILEASEEIDKVSVTQSGAIVTLSDIPAPLQIGQVISYLQRVSTTTDNGDVSVSLEPGQITTGLTMNVLPRVIEKDRVLLSLSIGIKEAQQPFQTFSASGVSIQLPEVNTTGFMQNAVLSTGETLILAGFEKNQNGYGHDGPPGGPFMGGTRSLEKSREVTVLMISSEILPEEPLTVLGE